MAPEDHAGHRDHQAEAGVVEGDGDALILKDMSQDGEEESIYDVVSDDEELEAVSGVFADMLEDVDLI